MRSVAARVTMRPVLMDYKTAAGALTVSVRTLRRLVADGEVIPVRIGRLVRFTHGALAEFVSRAEARADHGPQVVAVRSADQTAPSTPAGATADPRVLLLELQAKAADPWAS